MPQKKVIDIWKRTQYLLIRKHQKPDQAQSLGSFLERCYQLSSEKSK